MRFLKSAERVAGKKYSEKKLSQPGEEGGRFSLQEETVKGYVRFKKHRRAPKGRGVA